MSEILSNFISKLCSSKYNMVPFKYIGQNRLIQILYNMFICIKFTKISRISL
jgi:hypothetical protein